MKTDLVLLASGFSRRFGSNKLLYRIQSKTLIEHMLDTVECLDVNRVLVVSQYPEVEEIVTKRGYIYVHNDRAQEGLSASLKAGVSHCLQSDQILFLTADMPYLKTETLQCLLSKSDGQHIVCCECEGRLQNPMLFPKRYFEQLLTLKKEQGGKHIAQRYQCRTCFVMAEELHDIDTKDDIKKE